MGYIQLKNYNFGKLKLGKLQIWDKTREIWLKLHKMVYKYIFLKYFLYGIIIK